MLGRRESRLYRAEDLNGVDSGDGDDDDDEGGEMVMNDAAAWLATAPLADGCGKGDVGDDMAGDAGDIEGDDGEDGDGDGVADRSPNRETIRRAVHIAVMFFGSVGCSGDRGGRMASFVLDRGSVCGWNARTRQSKERIEGSEPEGMLIGRRPEARRKERRATSDEYKRATTMSSTRERRRPRSTVKANRHRGQRQ